MKRFLLLDILKKIDGELISGDDNTLIKYVTAKTHMMRNNTLFFHFSRKLDIKEFKDYKSPLIVTEYPDFFKEIENHAVIVKVKNISKAYWKFVEFYRGLFPIPIIGITGTCGKTTTKEMVKHILSTKYKVRCTYRSQNASYLDLHYLIRIDEKTQVGVFEMGVLWPDDLIDSCRHFQPQIRILLNIGVHHLKSCKTPEVYIKAKEKILSGLDPINGVLILNADDENIKKIDVSKFKRIIYFGFSEQADFQAKDISYVKEGMTFTLQYQKKNYQVYIPGLGKHNIYNALAAIAASINVGMNIKQACDRLVTFKHVEEHLEVHSGTGGCSVIVDTWNSSPPSMAAALQVLKEISNSRKTIALLGYMPQLGKGHYADEQYAKIGEKVVKTEVDLLVVGEQAKEIGRKALELGMDKNKVYFSNNGTEIYDIIRPFLNENTIVLLKITHRQMVKSSFVELKKKLI